jgi:hypothetical protein
MGDSAIEGYLAVEEDLKIMGKADAHRLGGLDQTEVRHGRGHRRKGVALVCADWCGRYQADQVLFANEVFCIGWEAR